MEAWPDDFRCPISLEVMTDPVILPSGHTFERRSIQRWLDGGHLTCPVTNLPLPPSPSLIPNHALRRLIAAVSPSSATAAAASPVPAAGGGDGSASTREAAKEAATGSPSSVQALLRLAKSGAAGRREVLESGSAAVLLRHAAAGDDSAARAVLLLSLDGDDARVGLVADGAVDALCAAVARGSAPAATALTSLATVDVNKCTIGAHPAAIPALVALLRRRRGADRQRREAATALFELCKLPENRRRAVRASAAAPLADFAADGSARAVEVLGLLVKCREGRHELCRVPEIVSVLTGAAGSGNARAIEQALFVLKWICSESSELAVEAIKLGAFQLCEALVNDDNCRIAKNAVELARTLEKA
ncbi:hypothetical protein PR202_ga30765 [Eleusine coracana subsp. coracana]|uniref:RING-type E3 ubiquitin transferase n=1 Tax=Eleusine coracana subsp. coracana TaxID=191504 RepID=A0AAV5DPT2_ELECO|nr:hypothetical protein QOZ80_8AG0616790 [Eleusine coracana subsp. coracana]GJN12485.1 hypothetical protein PR202_ga30765 [Eleusine coracana subsp. coracana]